MQTESAPLSAPIDSVRTNCDRTARGENSAILRNYKKALEGVSEVLLAMREAGPFQQPSPASQYAAQNTRHGPVLTYR
jgi:hypothetical protein